MQKSIKSIDTDHKSKVMYLDDMGLGCTSEGHFVPWCLPNETIYYTIKKFRRHKIIELDKVENASNLRQRPICKHFTQKTNHCGGCSLLHMNQTLYNKFKVERCMQAFYLNNLDVSTIMSLKVIGPYNRRRTNLEAIKKPDGIHLGFHKYHSHSIVHLDECHTLHPEIFQLLPKIKNALNIILTDYSKSQIFILKAFNIIDIIITIQGVQYLDDDNIVHLKNAFIDSNVRLTFKHGNKYQDILNNHIDPCLCIGSHNIKMRADNFCQPTDESDKILSSIVYDSFDEFSDCNIIDLFCGCGTLSVKLTDKFNIIGFDVCKHATRSYAELNIANINTRDLFLNPLTANELNELKISKAIINPPRAGAKLQVAEVAQSNIDHIVYVSCNPVTAAEDIALLTNSGFKIIKTHTIDSFFGSYHVELLCILQK